MRRCPPSPSSTAHLRAAESRTRAPRTWPSRDSRRDAIAPAAASGAEGATASRRESRLGHVRGARVREPRASAYILCNRARLPLHPHPTTSTSALTTTALLLLLFFQLSHLRVILLLICHTVQLIQTTLQNTSNNMNNKSSQHKHNTTPPTPHRVQRGGAPPTGPRRHVPWAGPQVSPGG